MRSLALRGELSSEDLVGLLSSIGVGGQGVAEYTLGSVRVVILIGDKYMMRTNDRFGVVVVAAADGSRQRIDLGSAGGAQGLLGVKWGAGESIERELVDALVQLLESRSLTYELGEPGSD